MMYLLGLSSGLVLGVLLTIAIDVWDDRRQRDRKASR